MDRRKHLLLVYHSQTGNTRKLAMAVMEGINHPDIDVETRCVTAAQADVDDLLWCDGLILGTPENFGYMSGALKDFMDRTYYPVEGLVQGLPLALFVSAGNDGSGAVSSIRRIGNGYGFREIQEPLIARGEVTSHHLADARQLGMMMAAGLEGGVY